MKRPDCHSALILNEGFASQLKTIMSRLVATPLRQSSSMTYVHKSLSEVKFVFVHQDFVRKPLQASYDRPFSVIPRKSKNFFIEENGKEDWILIDRLKIATILSSDMPDHEWVKKELTQPRMFRDRHYGIGANQSHHLPA